jgi:hypothetical protein
MEDDRKLKFIGIGGYMTESNIPKRLWDADSQSLVPKRFIPAIRKYVEIWDMERKWNRPDGLIVSGKFSEDAMTLILKKAISRHRKAYCIEYHELEEVCREWDSYEWLCKVDCLGVHGFPSRRQYQYKDECDVSYADRVISKRYYNAAPTILCSTESAGSVAAHIKKMSEISRRAIVSFSFLNTDVEELDVLRT